MMTKLLCTYIFILTCFILKYLRCSFDYILLTACKILKNYCFKCVKINLLPYMTGS